MDVANNTIASFWPESFPASPAVFLLLAVPVLAALLLWLRGTGASEPWSLPNWKGIPFIGNTLQYILDNGSFITRTTLALQNRDIIKFRLGPTKAYLITGAQNVQALFRKSTSVSADKFILMVMGSVMCYTKEDLAKYANDKTGRLAEPLDGTAANHKGPRYWYNLHHCMKTLSQSSSTVALTGKFIEFFQDRVQAYPLGEPVTVNLYHFMRTRMAGAATKALTGDKLLERVGEDELLDAFWAYDSVVMRLMYALPKWMDPMPWKVLDRMHRMALGWLQDDFDPVSDLLGNDVDDVEWHPELGLRFMREYLRWGKKSRMALETRAGYFIGFLIGLNANSIPIAAWALFELIQDRDLWELVQNEAESVFEINPATGQRVLNVQKMLVLPLLQSVYTEILRLHVSVNITREVVAETATIAGYKLPKNALIQAPTRIAHHSEVAWGTPEHPASEFWAHRHIKHITIQDENGNVSEKAEFAVAAGPNDFFPYGGGVSMCPGRHFAKQEIMSTIAIMVTTFDIEMIEWVTYDGKAKSDRPAQDNLKYSGAAALPPDRDMKVRWTRRV